MMKKNIYVFFIFGKYARNQQMKVTGSAHFSLCPVFWWFYGVQFDPEGGGDMVL
jgi:hypothetical protein